MFSILICLDTIPSLSVCQFRALPRQGPFFLSRIAGNAHRAHQREAAAGSARMRAIRSIMHATRRALAKPEPPLE